MSLDLDAVLRTHERALRCVSMLSEFHDPDKTQRAAYLQVPRDVPALVEEVQRTRAAVQLLERELEEERRNSAALRDERDRLRDELLNACGELHTLRVRNEVRQMRGEPS